MTTENISITPLQSHQILQAYPLIQTGDRNCSLAQWKNDAERLIQLPEHRGGEGDNDDALAVLELIDRRRHPVARARHKSIEVVARALEMFLERAAEEDRRRRCDASHRGGRKLRAPLH